MPRKAREISENGIYYIYTRCNEDTVLCARPADFERLMEIIAEAKTAMPFALFAFAITKCELHLIVKEFHPADISAVMKKICFDYTKYSNQSREQKGKLFKDRFKSQPVPTDSEFLPLIRFVHQTPLRKNEALNIGQYPFCSYPMYFREQQNLVDTSGILHYFSTDDAEALQKFKLFHAGLATADKKPAERFVATREQVADIITKIAGVPPKDIKLNEKSKRDHIIKRIKRSSNLSIRQIAFATQLSRNTISDILKSKTSIL